MAENFTNLMKTINPQIQEVQLTPSTRNMKKTRPSNIIINVKEKKTLKTGEERPQEAQGKNDSRYSFSFQFSRCCV